MSVGLLAVAAFTALAPAASAHCDGITGVIVVLDKCTIQQGLEAAVDRANAVLAKSAAFVLVKDFRFHPEVVTIRSGGTVTWLYGDVHQNQQHDPRSGGTCGSREADLAKCPPTVMSRCFDVLYDAGALMTRPGDAYPVTFRYDAAAAQVWKSHGLLSGGPSDAATGAEPFRACPVRTGSATAADYVVPYHCGLHGTATAIVTEMRGAIVVEA